MFRCWFKYFNQRWRIFWNSYQVKFQSSPLLKLDDEILEVGAGTLDRTLSRFAADNSILNFEFLSCIPGSVGGAIIMNSGCYGDEISNILIS